MAGKHPVTIKATITIFAQLAVAMVYELRLNTQVASDPPQLTCIPPVHMRPPQRPPRTLEECRAVMGTFVVISTWVALVANGLQIESTLLYQEPLTDCS